MYPNPSEGLDKTGKTDIRGKTDIGDIHRGYAQVGTTCGQGLYQIFTVQYVDTGNPT